MRDLFFIHRIAGYSISFLMATMLALLAACSGSSSTASGAAASTVATLQLSAAPTTINSDGVSQTTITVTAVDASNAVVPSTTVGLSANTGNLSTGSVTTDATGKATLTFTSGTLTKANRVATITAAAGSISAQIAVQIVGSTVAVNPPAATLPDDGSTTQTLTISAKDSANVAVPNTTVTLTMGGSGTATLAPPCTLAAPCTTNASGNVSVVATGTLAGTVTVTAAALGATSTATLTVSPSAATFSIDKQTLNGTVIANNTLTPMNIGDSLAVEVFAPAPTSAVEFATTVGVWNGGASAVVSVPVSGSPPTATATLTTTQGGVANITVTDLANSANSDSLTVTMTAPVSSANSITIQPSPALVAKSTSTTSGISTLTASVRDSNGFPVGGAPVVFTIINPTGGGETVSPVIAYTSTTTAGGLVLGDAVTTFTSGTKSSGAGGVNVRATVATNLGIATNTPPSGNDATIVIGGTAGSVTFGQATALVDNGTTYTLAMSVQVADSNGNPVQATAVNLSVWPIAWSTSSLPCVPDPDTATSGTFYNEDADENLILGPGEDGNRTYYSGAGSTPGGTKDGLITPPNSASGTLPGTVTTDATGVATFNLTYTKTNALWIIDRIRASTSVQGSQTVGQTVFRLKATLTDANPPTVCFLPPSPYLF